MVTTSALLRVGLESLVEVAGSAQSLAQAGPLIGALHPDVVVVEWEFDQVQDLIEFAADAPPLVVLDGRSGTGLDQRSAARRGARDCAARSFDGGDSGRDRCGGRGAGGASSAGSGGVPLVRYPWRRRKRSSPREIEVLRLMADGSSNKAIAWRLNISEHTVKFHVNSIFSKMNAGSRTEAVTLGLRQGLIPL